MNRHAISRQGAQLANLCIEKCNRAIAVCQKLRDRIESSDGATQGNQSVAALGELRVCIETCTEWSLYCRQHQESCSDEDCALSYEDALGKSDECIKACGEVIREITASTTGGSPEQKIAVYRECVEACDECIERCAGLLDEHL